MPFDPGNKILIITAPSGAGKTSITRHLLQHIPQLAFSVSAATREARGNERDGKGLLFHERSGVPGKDPGSAVCGVGNGHEGKYYGTLKSELDRIWANHQVPVLDIDVKGAIHVQQQYPNTTLSIFIEPPSVDELKRRLESRGTETAESLQARVNKASYEISFKHHFHRIVINAELTKAREEAMAIVWEFLES